MRICYSRAGVWIPPQTNPQPLAQRHVDLLEDTGKPPLTEVVVDAPPRREVAWQEPPRTAAFQEVEDCVEDGTRAMDPRSTAGLRRRKMWRQAAPFGVGEIGRIYGHATERTLPPSCASYFSDSFGRVILRSPYSASRIARSAGPDSRPIFRPGAHRATHHLVPPHKDSGCCIERPGLAAHHRPRPRVRWSTLAPGPRS